MLSKVDYYIKYNRGICFYCHSPNIRSDGRTYDDQGMLEKMLCLDCNMQWYDDYTFKGVSEILK
jgi:hypothetical protein